MFTVAYINNFTNSVHEFLCFLMLLYYVVKFTILQFVNCYRVSLLIKINCLDANSYRTFQITLNFKTKEIF